MEKRDTVIGYLKHWIKSGNTPQKICFRCELILCYLKRSHTQLVALDMKCNWSTAHKWINRWKNEIPKIFEAWDQDDFNPKNAIYAILQDSKRSGPKPKYTKDQIAQMVAIACLKPEKFNRPITHWTYRELADELVKQGIVKSIPESTLRSFLKSDRPSPS